MAISAKTLNRRGFHALAAAGIAGAVLEVGQAASASPDPEGNGGSQNGGSDDPALRQTVNENENFAKGQPVVIDAHHVDLGPRIIDGSWVLAARDDTGQTPVWRLPEDIVFQVHDAGLLAVPSGDAYSFIGAPAGEKVYVIPQTEIPSVVWLGWNTQDPEVVKQCPRGVTLRFTHVDGPGNFTLFLQPGNFAPPQLLVDSKKLTTAPADIFVDTNTHTHANWVFTKPGIYLIQVEALAQGQNNEQFSAVGTLRFAVGDSTSPEEALGTHASWENHTDGLGGEKNQRTTASPDATQRAASDTQDQVSPSKGSPTLPWLIGGGSALALTAGGAGYLAIRRRDQAHQRAAEQATRSSGPEVSPDAGTNGTQQ